MGKLLAFVVAATTSLVGLVAPPAAGLIGQSTTCSFDATATFDPGLTFPDQEQQIRLTGTLSGCVGGGVTGGTVVGRGGGVMSCLSGSGTGQFLLKWNTGERSGASIELTPDGTLTGEVTKGKFAGEALTGDLTAEPLDGDCFFSPVTQVHVFGSVSV